MRMRAWRTCGLLALSVAFGLAACAPATGAPAPRYAWAHPYKTTQAFYRDQARCTNLAALAYPSPPSHYTPMQNYLDQQNDPNAQPLDSTIAGLRQSQADLQDAVRVAAERQDYVNNCLRAQGYYLVRVN